MIERLKNNDRQAFNELVALYKDKVISTCYRFLLNQQDAEDTAQEVFIEIFQSIQKFKGEAKLSTWIYRITVSKCLDALKKQKRKKRISNLKNLLPIDLFGHLKAPNSQTDQQLIEQDNLNEIQIALNKLPENQRIAFTLSKIDGFTNSEIAEIMAVSLLAVESLIYRAKKQIATDLMKILKNNS